MNIDNKLIKKFSSWIVVLLIPTALILTAVRVVLSPWFLEFEYRTPYFPEDPFGFTLEDRLTYANLAREYLLNDADISFLGDLRFPEGEQTPPLSCQFMDDCSKLFNERELEHMVDVKNVVDIALNLWVASVILLLVIGVWAMFRKGEWLNTYMDSIAKGGWVTVFLVGLILLFVLIAFGIAFVLFHEIFFESGTWMFFYSDTLIRLFPERFWRDTFLVVGILAVGVGLLLGILIPRYYKPKN